MSVFCLSAIIKIDFSNYFFRDLHAFEDGVKLYEGLQKYFYFYNNERIHQSLDYKTPTSQYGLVA